MGMSVKIFQAQGTADSVQFWFFIIWDFKEISWDFSWDFYGVSWDLMGYMMDTLW
jgi:hypothetical protein